MSAWSLDTVPLETMSLTEKLSLIERVWESLTAVEGDYVSPGWHGEELQSRQDKVTRGEAVFSSVNDVRQRLKKVSE